MARGFILQPFTYLRDAWNWLDFVVIALAWVVKYSFLYYKSKVLVIFYKRFIKYRKYKSFLVLYFNPCKSILIVYWYFFKLHKNFSLWLRQWKIFFFLTFSYFSPKLSWFFLFSVHFLNFFLIFLIFFLLFSFFLFSFIKNPYFLFSIHFPYFPYFFFIFLLSCCIFIAFPFFSTFKK